MRVCPLCQARYEDNVRKCPYDGRRPLAESVIAASGGDALLGATLAERYTIVGRVGAGGMGTVYRAEQAPMNREIALKVLRRDLGRDPETVARFHREAHTLSKLSHPNTVTIFDFGQTDDGLLYLAMELLEGEMLSSRLKRVGPIDVPVAIRIAAGVLRSLAEAHAREIIHRDLKPDNIFLAQVHGRPEEAEMVKVVDFGIAKIRDGEPGLEPLQTQEGTVFGTPRYMSPEQAQGKSLDGRSDLYAVGTLLFHMLTGQPPFTDDDAVVVMAHHIKTVPPPVREAMPGRAIPAALEALVARALEKEPSRRPQTAEDFLAELEATASEAKALASEALAPISTPTPPRTTRRTRVMAWAGAAVLGLLAVTAGLTYGTPRHAAVAARRVTAPRIAIARPPLAPAAAVAPPSPMLAPVIATVDTEPQAVAVPVALEAAPAPSSTTNANDPPPGSPAHRTGTAAHPGGHGGQHGSHGNQPYNRWSD